MPTIFVDQSVASIDTIVSLVSDTSVRRRDLPSSSRRHGDGLRARRVAEPVVEASAAGRQVVAAVCAPAAVAEPDVVRRREAVRVRRIEARRAPGVHGARAAADVFDASTTVRDRGDLGRARGERVDGLADEGELGIGRREPMQHLLVGHEVGRGLGWGTDEYISRMDGVVVQRIPPRWRQPQLRSRRAEGILAEAHGELRIYVATHSSERSGHPDTGESQHEDGEAGEVAQELHGRGR